MYTIMRNTVISDLKSPITYKIPINTNVPAHTPPTMNGSIDKEAFGRINDLLLRAVLSLRPFQWYAKFDDAKYVHKYTTRVFMALFLERWAKLL